MYIHSYIYTYIHTSESAYIQYAHTCTYIHTYIHTYIYTYIHTHLNSPTYSTYTCTYIHTHTYIHTYIQLKYLNVLEITEILWGHAVMGLPMAQDLYSELELQVAPKIGHYIPAVVSKYLWSVSELQVCCMYE